MTPTTPSRIRAHKCGPILFLLLSLLLTACGKTNDSHYQGYAEAEFTYISSPLGGRLMDLSVQRGRQVQAGDLLFALESVPEATARQEATDRLNQAKAKLANMEKGLRPSEIKGIEARLAQAKSAQDLSRLEFKRHEKLYKDTAISRSTMDKVSAQYQSDQDRVAELTAQLETARLGARSDEILAAREEVAALAARLTLTVWNLEQKTQAAPHAGLVFDTFYTQGELVPPGRPVVSLLVPGNLKVRFFVPEPEFSGWKSGQKVALSCDGCPEEMTAEITYISPRVEFTPPVIYSQETRSKLVYMLEARPDTGKRTADLHPGQPMEVRRISQGAEPVKP